MGLQSMLIVTSIQLPDLLEERVFVNIACTLVVFSAPTADPSMDARQFVMRVSKS
jgi:hypothetical protein